MQLRTRSVGFVRTEGGILPPDLLERVRALDRTLPGFTEATYGLRRTERFGEAITRAWLRLQSAWATFAAEVDQLPDSDPATTPTRERFLLPLFEELGYGRLAPVRAVELDGKSYPVSHAYAEVVPLHLVGAHVPLDRRSRGVAGAAGQSPHGLVQELLNRSPERLWGIVSNGRTLRLLRDNASLTRQAYVEFDLEAIFAGEAYADFALLWHLAHRTRLEPRVPEDAEEGSAPRADGAWIERWSAAAAESGTRARDKLRDGVQEAIEALGSGFLRHPANGELRRALVAGALTTQDYYRELLRLVYRLILLFVAEDRDLLLDPQASTRARERYGQYYSTARLRHLAERRRGTRHADLYAGFSVVVRALGSEDGAPAIGLPPLGGFLFGPEACPHLDAAAIANADLLDAVRRLATIEEKGVRRIVDYRNLGSEELGSIYESLLELHPELDTVAGSFALRSAAGHERKTTGSYYTPTALITELLDSALDPVLDEAARKPDPAQAILDLTVLDPAAGSGHFLVAAAHRIARRLAQVRTGDEEPSPDAVRASLRDVIGRCLYGIDLNPMAVELCKVSLWMEAMDPGKPLSFLDHHIVLGNSLLGTTPRLLGEGIPDEAFAPLEGDDRRVVADLRRRNRQERGGQQVLAFGPAVSDLVRPVAEALEALEALPADSPAQLARKELAWADLQASAASARAKLVADAWCAAFVIEKRPGVPVLTQGMLRQLIAAPDRVDPALRDEVGRLAEQYRFFHPHLTFPGVFRVPPAGYEPEDPGAGWSGGFDVVLGNPPWERVKLQEKEWFAARRPDIAAASTAAARKRLIDRLAVDDPTLYRAWLAALRQADGESHLVRDSGRYPLCGRGDVNTYAVFAELMRNMIGGTGRSGVIVPSGIATDDTTKFFFRDLVEHGSLASLFDFENKRIFPAVHSSYKFCLLTLTGSRRPVRAAEFVFFAHATADLADPERRFTLSAEDFALLNPNTRTCPIFRSRRDAEITKAIYRRVPVLANEEGREAGNPWGVSFMAMFHMSNDSGLFRTREQLEADGWRLEGNVFIRKSERYLPLYEAKMVHQFDHRFGDYRMQPPGSGDTQLPDMPVAFLADPDYAVLPRYWVAEDEVAAQLSGRWDRGWLLGWRDICRSTDVRTVIAAVIPRAAVGDKFLLMMPALPSRSVAALLPALDSCVFDYCARQKLGGTSLKYYVMKQLPVLPPAQLAESPPWQRSGSAAEWTLPRVLELTYTAWDLYGFARDLGWDGPPFRYDPERRALLRAELDAAFFHLYGIERDDVDYIMDTLPIVRKHDEQAHGEYRTKRLVLEAYDAMDDATRSGRPYRTILDPPPADPSVAHPPRPGEPPGRWIEPDEGRRAGAHAVTGAPLEAVAGSPARSAYPGRRTHGMPGSRAVDRRPGWPAATAGTDGTAQGSLDQLARSALAGDAWLPESAIDPAELQPGRAVRHRSWGTGTIVWVRGAGHSTSLVVRFPSGDHEIVFGLGMLEFAS